MTGTITPLVYEQIRNKGFGEHGSLCADRNQELKMAEEIHFILMNQISTFSFPPTTCFLLPPSPVNRHIRLSCAYLLSLYNPYIHLHSYLNLSSLINLKKRYSPNIVQTSRYRPKHNILGVFIAVVSTF